MYSDHKDTRKEVWVKIKGFPNYKISILGKIKLHKKRKLTGKYVSRILGRRYRYNSHVSVRMYAPGGKRETRTVIVLMADHFLIPRTPGAPVEFIDKSKPEDCSLWNIREKGSKRSGRQNYEAWRRSRGEGRYHRKSYNPKRNKDDKSKN